MASTSGTPDETDAAYVDKFRLDADQQRRYDRLLAWFIKNGGSLHPNVYIGEGQFGVGLFARGTLEPEGQLLRIVRCPKSCAFSITDMYKIAPWWPQSFVKEFVKFPEVLIRLLLIETFFAGTESHWYPYIRTLPYPGQSAFTTPMYWPEPVLQMVQGTDVAAAVRDRKSKWTEELKNCCESLKKLAPAHVEHVETRYTWEMYLWAATVFTTRCFQDLFGEGFFDRRILRARPDMIPPDISAPCSWRRAVIEGNLKSVKQIPILLPVYDLANHDPDQSVLWGPEDDLTVFSHFEDPPNRPDTLLAGQEVYNNYGSKHNEELIMGYGFSLPDGGFRPGLQRGLNEASYNLLIANYSRLYCYLGPQSLSRKWSFQVAAAILNPGLGLRIQRNAIELTCRQLIEMKFVAQANLYTQTELARDWPVWDTFTTTLLLLDEVRNCNVQIHVLDTALHRCSWSSEPPLHQVQIQAELAKSYNLDVSSTLTAIVKQLEWGRDFSKRFHERCWRYDNMLEDSPAILAIPFRQFCRSEFGTRHVGRDQPFEFEMEPYALMVWLAHLVAMPLDLSFNAKDFDEELLDELEYLEERYGFPTGWLHHPDCPNRMCFRGLENIATQGFDPAKLAQTVSAERKSKIETLQLECWVREDTLKTHKRVVELLRACEYFSKWPHDRLCTLAFWATSVAELEAIWGHIDELDWDVYTSGVEFDKSELHWFLPCKRSRAKEPEMPVFQNLKFTFPNHRPEEDL